MNVKPMFVFPKWVNGLTLGVLFVLATAPLYVGILVPYMLQASTLNVGYAPVQPVPYSHALHVGKLGLDCRYCHNTVEKAGFAAVPPTETCMNCHAAIWKKSPKLQALRDSYGVIIGDKDHPELDGKPELKGKAIPWVKIHDLPDYAYFNHSAHVNVGIGCNQCHGQINHMEVVYNVAPLNMAWCLSCHRSPESHLRPRNQVTNMEWWEKDFPKDMPEFTKEFAASNKREPTTAEYQHQLALQYHVNPNTDCVTCHR